MQGSEILYTSLCFGHFCFSHLCRFLENGYKNSEIDIKTRISRPRPETQKIYRPRFKRFKLLTGLGTTFSAARGTGRRAGCEYHLYVLIFGTFLFPGAGKKQKKRIENQIQGKQTTYMPICVCVCTCPKRQVRVQNSSKSQSRKPPEMPKQAGSRPKSCVASVAAPCRVPHRQWVKSLAKTQRHYCSGQAAGKSS